MLLSVSPFRGFSIDPRTSVTVAHSVTGTPLSSTAVTSQLSHNGTSVSEMSQNAISQSHMAVYMNVCVCACARDRTEDPFLHESCVRDRT